MFYDGFDKLIDVSNVVLPVSVELDGNVVAHFVSIFVAGLDSATDAEIGNEIDMVVMMTFDNGSGSICGTVINDDIVIMIIKNSING